MTDLIILELQKIFRKELDYFKNDSIVVSEIESDIEKIPLTMFPGMVIMPGSDSDVSDDNGNIKTFNRDIEIVYANHYRESNIILFGNKKTKGILTIETDIKKILSDYATLNGKADELVSYNLQPGILANLKHFNPARKVLLTYKVIEIFRSF